MERKPRRRLTWRRVIVIVGVAIYIILVAWFLAGLMHMTYLGPWGVWR
jgi:preprotein translocase subunit SecE